MSPLWVFNSLYYSSTVIINTSNNNNPNSKINILKSHVIPRLSTTYVHSRINSTASRIHEWFSGEDARWSCCSCSSSLYAWWTRTLPLFLKLRSFCLLLYSVYGFKQRHFFLFLKTATVVNKAHKQQDITTTSIFNETRIQFIYFQLPNEYGNITAIS